jgi:23S rRNA (uracil1939-C5)-methyltransferase
MTSLSLNLNSERTNVILGRRLIPVRGDLCIEDTMCGLRFRISPLSFYQVNTAQAERLYRQAMEFAALTGSETVIDLYCGIGTITLLAAKHAARVIGVEIVPEAVRDAEANAVLNGIDNAQFRAGKAEEILPALKDEGICPDVLIVDPPRAGLDPSCIDAIRHLAPSRIVYISCNPATLARDLKLLISLPIQDEDDAQESLAPCYRLTAARAYDLFPRSIHVETVVLLSKNFERPKDFVQIGIDAEDYYSIKDAK